jgi:hypothetical protein
MDENPYQSPQTTGAAFESIDAPPKGSLIGKLFRSVTRIILALILIPFAFLSCGGAGMLVADPNPEGFACFGVLAFISIVIIILIRQIPR